MRRLLLLVTVVGVVLIGVYRERIFLRDPIGHVERDGVRLPELRVFLNYSNDVMVQSPDLATSYIVQGWNRLPGIPAHLMCVQGLVCVTEAEHASAAPMAGLKRETKVEMTNRVVSFRAGDGALVQVILR